MSQRSLPRELVFGQSLGASFNSGNLPNGVIDGTAARSFAVVVTVTGSSTLNGTLSLQGHVNKDEPLPWPSMPSMSTVVTGDGKYIFDVTVTGMSYFVIDWARTAGSATAKIQVSAKLET